MRKRLFEIIEKSDGSDLPGRIYDLFMIAVILGSLVPLAFKTDLRIFVVVDRIAVAVFIADYLLRWFTADFKFDKRSVWSFMRYPFSPMAIIDLVSILPSLSLMGRGFKMLRVLRMLRALRVLRVFKWLRYSRNFEIMSDVIRDSKNSLIAVGSLAAAYIMVSALVIFNVEPDSFETFFDAVYWATVSLTTVGYGDIYPVSVLGRIVAMVSSMMGIAIVALPAGILTAGYMDELHRDRDSAPENARKDPAGPEKDAAHPEMSGTGPD
ncbi:MAG: ion transporter [Clostridia bacterium]|nr:ion transporter [Clostridia bacterium]